jgi:hypothetical protein
MIRRIGIALMALGVVAVILGLTGRVPRILHWIYNWGEVVSWIIRALIIAVGALIYFFSAKREEA